MMTFVLAAAVLVAALCTATALDSVTTEASPPKRHRTLSLYPMDLQDSDRLPISPASTAT
jgi:hypothetical protein